MTSRSEVGLGRLRPRQKTLRALVTSCLLGAVVGAASPALAGPSVWAKARDPDLERRSQAIAQAEARLMKALNPRDSPHDRNATLREAKDILLRAGAETSRDRLLRLRLAETLFALGDHAAVIPLYESLLRGDMPAPARAVAYRDLALSYGHLGRRDEEIAAYGEALTLQSHGGPRALLLANRAEAYMARGDLSLAIEGYRAALGSLTQMQMPFGGVTTLWGLAVALDRSGDLDEGLAAIRLARSYDASDNQIHDRTSWFFEPPYEEHWYAALGHWSAARFAELGAARAEWYGRAVSAWEEYIASAPQNDRWVAMAQVRLRQCEKERDLSLRRSGPPKKIPAADPARRRSP